MMKAPRSSIKAELGYSADVPRSTWYTQHPRNRGYAQHLISLSVHNDMRLAIAKQRGRVAFLGEMAILSGDLHGDSSSTVQAHEDGTVNDRHDVNTKTWEHRTWQHNLYLECRAAQHRCP